MDINAISGSGLAPIHILSSSGLIDCVRALCWRTDLDVNLWSRTPRAFTALMFAAYEGRDDVMRVLLAYPGTDPEAVAATGKSAFAIAKQRNFEQCANLLRPEGREIIEVIQRNPRPRGMTLISRVSGRFRPGLVL
jgi:hypothetical protein